MLPESWLEGLRQQLSPGERTIFGPAAAPIFSQGRTDTFLRPRVSRGRFFNQNPTHLFSRRASMSSSNRPLYFSACLHAQYSSSVILLQFPDIYSRTRCIRHHAGRPRDRKSTRLNSSHLGISYAV